MPLENGYNVYSLVAGALEIGRGLVDISNTSTDKAVVLVVYDSVSGDSAQIIRIDEAANPPSYSVIVTSNDIKGWNIDNESPIPDNKGGFYLGAYSGDANAEPGSNTSKDSTVYHWNNTKKLTQIPIENAQTTADLVIAEGQHAGKIIGVELEKPFTDGKDGIYFMMEIFLQIPGINSDDWDAICHWNSTNGVKNIYMSTRELEVENPPLDGNNGFYFVAGSTLLG